MLYCENCHAPIPEESAKCPYCGAFNASGGERQYMEQLYDLKEDVEELSEVPEMEYRREMGKIGRMLFRTFLVFAGLAAVCAGVAFLYQKSIDYEITPEEMREQAEWEREVFPKLDALYAAGDYDGVMECVFENQAESYYSIDNWKHADFINVYTWYQTCTEGLDKADSEGYDAEKAGECILDVLFLIQERKYDSYTEDEESLIEAYQEEVKRKVGTVFGVQEEALTLLYEECRVEDEYGVYFDYQTAKKKVKNFVKKQIKTN